VRFFVCNLSYDEKCWIIPEKKTIYKSRIDDEIFSSFMGENDFYTNRYYSQEGNLTFDLREFGKAMAAVERDIN
jgi:hypothetical protein